MQTLTIEQKQTNPPKQELPATPNLAAIKAKQKQTWESGDYGQIARRIEGVAEEFMARQPLRSGLRVLDAACGTGNLALLAARHGCAVSGIDIAANLLAQARTRAQAAKLAIEFNEADAEALPYGEDTFDLAVSMFGVMFAPRPETVVDELRRVIKPGGQLAMANWTPEGFIGKMFRVFKTHLPPPAGIPSPLEWGSEDAVRQRLQTGFVRLQLTRHMAIMRFSFPPAETVEYFRQHYGPTLRAFESLPASGQAALRRDLVDLQTRHNTAQTAGHTEVVAEYMQIVATKI